MFFIFMNKIFYFSLIFLLFSCGGTGIEGHVDEPITITANNPEEGQDFDYIWSLTNQPDGSLINSGERGSLKGPLTMKLATALWLLGI